MLVCASMIVCTDMGVCECSCPRGASACTSACVRARSSAELISSRFFQSLVLAKQVLFISNRSESFQIIPFLFEHFFFEFGVFYFRKSCHPRLNRREIANRGLKNFTTKDVERHEYKKVFFLSQINFHSMKNCEKSENLFFVVALEIQAMQFPGLVKMSLKMERECQPKVNDKLGKSKKVKKLSSICFTSA